jgi:hypothetical protein
VIALDRARTDLPGRRVAQARQVPGPRADIELLERCIAAVVVAQARDLARGVLRFPKWIARAGQVWAQAGTISPSRIGRRSLPAAIRTFSIRCTQ